MVTNSKPSLHNIYMLLQKMSSSSNFENVITYGSSCSVLVNFSCFDKHFRQVRWCDIIVDFVEKEAYIIFNSCVQW